MPTVTVLAGPNGAGKSWFSDFLVEVGFISITPINTDALKEQIDTNLLPHDPLRYEKSIRKETDKIFIQLLQSAIHKHEDFAFESNLRTDQLSCLSYFENAGYEINLIYIWLDGIEISKERVNARVNEGGHLVGDRSIVGNFNEGLRNLDLSVSDNHWNHVYLIDNSKTAKAKEDSMSLLIEIDNGEIITLSNNFFTPEREKHLPLMCDFIRNK